MWSIQQMYLEKAMKSGPRILQDQFRRQDYLIMIGVFGRITWYAHCSSSDPCSYMLRSSTGNLIAWTLWSFISGNGLALLQLNSVFMDRNFIQLWPSSLLPQMGKMIKLVQCAKDAQQINVWWAKASQVSHCPICHTVFKLSSQSCRIGAMGQSYQSDHSHLHTDK